MKMRLRGWLCLIFAGFFVCPAARTDDLPKIRVLTSEFPPYNFSSEGETIGVSVDVVRAVLDELGISAPVENMPWARIYQLAQAEPNTLIFSITRTADREKLFKWVGTIAPVDYSFFARKGRAIRLASTDEARAYRIATTNADVVDQLVSARGFALVERVSGQGAYEQNIQKLVSGRVDLWGVATLPGRHFLKNMEQEGRVERIAAIPELASDGMYLAFGAKTPDAVVSRFRVALEVVKRRGVDQQALKKYGQ